MASPKAPLRIPATKGKTAWPMLSVFPGDHRESWLKYGGCNENFRVQFGDKFYRRPGERRSFLSAAEVGQLLGERIADVFGVGAGESSTAGNRVNLYIPLGAKVVYAAPGMMPRADVTNTTPFPRDGEWFVGLAYSRKEVPITAVKPRTMSAIAFNAEPEECKGRTHEDEDRA